MPAKSEKQRRMMGAALAHKRGESPDASARVRALAASMTEQQLQDYATKDGNEKTDKADKG